MSKRTCNEIFVLRYLLLIYLVTDKLAGIEERCIQQSPSRGSNVLAIVNNRRMVANSFLCLLVCDL